jgi:hypothetical protein
MKKERKEKPWTVKIETVRVANLDMGPLFRLIEAAREIRAKRQAKEGA